MSQEVQDLTNLFTPGGIDSLSPNKKSLIMKALSEWYLFDRGSIKENVDPGYVYVGKYWNFLGMDYDGRDVTRYWSAAFISYVVYEAGGYSGFKYSQSHCDYVREAIKGQKKQDKNYPFWCYDRHEQEPQLGDIVCCWRREKTTYDQASQDEKWYASHCDIIVGMDQQKVFTIGGNVDHSVGVNVYGLDDAGFLKDEKKVYALMENQR